MSGASLTPACLEDQGSSSRSQADRFSQTPPSLSHRFCTYLVLFSFLFQTLWPSVVWAEPLIREKEALGGHARRHSLSLGVQIDDRDDESLAKTSSQRLQVDFDQGLDKLKVAVARSLEVQTLYPGLEVQEQGLKWSSFGLMFWLTYQGTLTVTADPTVQAGTQDKPMPKKPLVRLFNPHGAIILGPELTVEHIQARAQDVFLDGPCSLKHLEVWAEGGQILENPAERTAQKGTFKILPDAKLTTKFLTIHQGSTDVQGTLSLTKKGVLDAKGNTVTNQGTLKLGSEVTVRQVSDFQNDGTLKGRGLTLEQTTFTNTDQLAVKELRLQNSSWVNNGQALVQHWHQDSSSLKNALGARFKVTEQSTFKNAQITNKGQMALQGDAQGTIDTFTNQSSLIIGSASTLKVNTFTSTGTFQASGPLQWSGSAFATAQTVLQDRASFDVPVMRTTGDFTAASDVTVQGSWHHEKGKAKLNTLSFAGSTLDNKPGATLIVSGQTQIQAKTLTNSGTLTLAGKVQGQVEQMVNHGVLTFQQDTHLTGSTLINDKDFQAQAIFDWLGETLQNTTTGKMTLFDNRVAATKQVINQGLLLWMHNTFRTWHFLNLGWAEMTQDLTGDLPLSFVSPQDQSMAFKKGMVENRGVLNLAPQDYTPRLTIASDRSFDHWLNDGTMVLPTTHFQAKTFKNKGTLQVKGDVKGTVEAFENTKKAIFHGTVNLTGKSLSTTGMVTFAQNTTLKVDNVTTGGNFNALEQLTLQGKDWTNLEDGKVDIVRLLFQGKTISNEGEVLIRDLLSSSSYPSQTIQELYNNRYRRIKTGPSPLFRIVKGGAALRKVINCGDLVLEKGWYRFQDIENTQGSLEVDWLCLEGKKQWTLTGFLHAKATVLSLESLINKGKTIFDYAALKTDTLENQPKAELTIGSGSSTLGTLVNHSILTLAGSPTLKVDVLHNSQGTIQSRTDLRLLMLDPDQKPQTDTFFRGPTVWAKVKDKKHEIHPGTLKVKNDLLLEMDPWLHVAESLHKFGSQWQCEGTVRLYSDLFRADKPLTYPGSVYVKVRDFQNEAHPLVFRALEVETETFRLGKNNDQLALIETKADSKKPYADTSLNIRVTKGDLDSRYGRLLSQGSLTLTSLAGDVLVGESLGQTKQKPAWESGCYITHPYHTANGSFLASQGNMTLTGKNIVWRLAQVKTQGFLSLIAQHRIHHLASQGFAKRGIKVQGERFDLEIFPSDYCQLNRQTQHSSWENRHLWYTFYGMAQTSVPGSLETLGDIEFKTKVTRVFGSKILAAGHLIDDKGTVWVGRQEACPFITYESQALRSKWFESGQGGTWYTGSTDTILAIVQAGKEIKIAAPGFSNSGYLSGYTLTLEAAQAAFQHLGKEARAAVQTLMDLGLLSVKPFLQQDLTSNNNGLIRQLPDGRVEQRGTPGPSDTARSLSQLPILGQRHLGAPAQTKLYMTLSLEQEKLQQMMAYAFGRVHHQGLSGEALYQDLLAEGQQQAAKGALATLMKDQHTKPFISYLLEKVKDQETQEEHPLAVMQLFVPPALLDAPAPRSGEARAQQQLTVITEEDLTSVGGAFRSEKDKVKIDVGGDFKALSDITTQGSHENYQQTATPTRIEAPKDSVDVMVDGDATFQGAKVLAEKKINIDARTVTDQATRLDSHSVNHQGKKKTTTHTVDHDVSEYRTTGDNSTIGITSQQGPLVMQAPQVLTGKGGKTTLQGHGVLISDVHNERQVESIEQQKDGGLLGGSTTIKDFYQSSTSQGAVFNNILEIIDSRGTQGITLVGADCRQVTKVILDSREGLIKLLAGINASLHFHSEQSKNVAWQSYEHDKTTSQTYSPCQFSPDCEFEVKSSLPVEVEQVRGQALEWLEPLRRNLEKNGGQLNLTEMDEIFTHDHVAQQGPTAALGLVVALAITIATSGTMSHVGATLATSMGMTVTTAGVTSLTTAGLIVQTMTAATLASLCSSAGMCLLNNLENPGKAVQAFLKTETFQAAFKAAAAAGLLRVLGNACSAPTSAGEATDKALAEALKLAEQSGLNDPTALQVFQSALTHQAAFQAVNMAVHSALDVIFQQSLEKSLGHGVVNFAVGLIGGVGANQIGAAYAQGVFEAMTHKLLHAGLGAATGAIMAKEKGALAGAMGAFVAETFADMLASDKPMSKLKALQAEKGRPLTAEEFTHSYQAELEGYKPTVGRVRDWAKVTAATAALLANQDVTVAAMTATNAVENNFALLAFYGVMAASVAYSGYQVYQAYEEGGPMAALQQLGIEVAVNAGGAVAGRAIGAVVYKVGGMAYPTIQAALTAVLDKTPGLRIALGKMVDKLVLASDAVAQSALGKAAAKAEAKLANLENKVADKIGIPKAKKQVKFTEDYSAKIPSNAVKLRTELALKDAGLLDAEGKLTQRAIKESFPIDLKDGVIRNPLVVKELTKDGSPITAWKKYYSPSATLPNGQKVQIHYYKNEITGKIDYLTKDFKVSGEIKL